MNSKQNWRRLLCWWFGCRPYFQCSHDQGDATPCARCGAPDCCYGDMVGDTRHARLKRWLRYWLWRRWVPAKCEDCGKRFGGHDQCLPF